MTSLIEVVALPTDTKQLKIRKEVWNRLYDEDLLEIPTLPYKIVPFFKVCHWFFTVWHQMF